MAHYNAYVATRNCSIGTLSFSFNVTAISGTPSFLIQVYVNGIASPISATISSVELTGGKFSGVVIPVLTQLVNQGNAAWVQCSITNATKGNSLTIQDLIVSLVFTPT